MAGFRKAHMRAFVYSPCRVYYNNMRYRNAAYDLLPYVFM